MPYCLKQYEIYEDSRTMCESRTYLGCDTGFRKGLTTNQKKIKLECNIRFSPKKQINK